MGEEIYSHVRKQHVDSLIIVRFQLLLLLCRKEKSASYGITKELSNKLAHNVNDHTL